MLATLHALKWTSSYTVKSIFRKMQKPSPLLLHSHNNATAEAAAYNLHTGTTWSSFSWNPVTCAVLGRTGEFLSLLLSYSLGKSKGHFCLTTISPEEHCWYIVSLDLATCPSWSDSDNVTNMVALSAAQKTLLHGDVPQRWDRLKLPKCIPV